MPYIVQIFSRNIGTTSTYGFLTYVGAVVPRYFFDVHDDGPAEWDDTGRECSDDNGIESHVRALLTLTFARQKARIAIVATTTVIVHREAGGIVLTALAKLGQDVQFVWSRS